MVGKIYLELNLNTSVCAILNNQTKSVQGVSKLILNVPSSGQSRWYSFKMFDFFNEEKDDTVSGLPLAKRWAYEMYLFCIITNFLAVKRPLDLIKTLNLKYTSY